MGAAIKTYYLNNKPLFMVDVSDEESYEAIRKKIINGEIEF